ncbi:MAG: MFS transporter [Ilumatobacter sp.]|nr:MFS transporter [Ilumatobacter sp.]
MSVATLVLTIDLFGVSVALPTIGRELGGSTSSLQWVTNAYSLSLAALLIPAGRISDLVGRRRVAVLGLVSFALASLACGTAQSMEILIVARAAQGGAAAMIAASALSITSNSVSDENRSLAIGIWTGVSAIGSAIGPLMGGFATDLASWRWFFIVNIGVSVVLAILTYAVVDESVDPSAQTPLDWLGGLLLLIGLSFTTVGIMQGPTSGWGTPVVSGSLVMGLCGLFLFWRHERRTENPLVELNLFSSRSYFGTSVVAFVGNGAYGMFLFFISLYLQQVLDLSALSTGLVFLTFTLPYAAGSPVVGKLQKRVEAPPLLVSGLVVLALSFALFALAGTERGLIAVISGMVVAAIGQALVFNVSGVAAMTSIPREKSGIASGMISTVRQGGSLIGLAAAGALFKTAEVAALEKSVSSSGLRLSSAETAAVSDEISGSPAAAQKLAALSSVDQRQVDEIISDAFVVALRCTMLTFAALMILTAVLARRILKRGVSPVVEN